MMTTDMINMDVEIIVLVWSVNYKVLTSQDFAEYLQEDFKKFPPFKTTTLKFGPP